MTSISNDYSLPKPSQAVRSGDSLGKDDFLKLLLIQLQNQDPSNPVDDREFIAQMATFSSLEQMTNMNKTLESFVQSQSKQTLLQYSELIDKEITYEIADSTSVEGEQKTAKVTSVKYDRDRVLQIGLDDGTWILEKQIVGIAQGIKDQGE
ncbi:flagellar hook assembly protein FlgD [Alkalicoccobacillus gibsonii]|jgi:flagellar basal-body rod modification protein FlgD|uniref:Flagellar hook assembly protein FlgD n=1 Tax=Alkalicoccobacillus gibsonii TaxID=79881 RepID=A0ABU9VIV5_9BACI|nr:flagellar hook assembly protein FlgD [Alkalicoccobacillus gibsonii]MBM0065153.1 flagellar hook assembly protein FlgD [Alkalicoccobacillus gibsonii]